MPKGVTFDFEDGSEKKTPAEKDNFNFTHESYLSNFVVKSQ